MDGGLFVWSLLCLRLFCVTWGMLGNHSLRLTERWEKQERITPLSFGPWVVTDSLSAFWLKARPDWPAGGWLWWEHPAEGPEACSS